MNDSLVVQDNVGQPDVFSWYVEHFHILVIGWIPHQTIVGPFLLASNVSLVTLIDFLSIFYVYLFQPH